MTAPIFSSQRLPERIGTRSVLGLAWPIVVSMLSYTAMGVVDTLFIARLGTAALAASGLAVLATHFFQSFPCGLMRGIKVNTAQAVGGEKFDLAERFGWQGVWLALVAGLLVVPFVALDHFVFGLLSPSREVADLASDYFCVRLLGAPLVFLGMALAAWFQGRGDTRTPMHAALGANALNIVLDPLLIFGWGWVPALGVGGAALATVTGFGFQTGWLGIRFLRARRGAPIFPSGELLRRVWQIGSPVGLQWTVDVGSWLVFGAVLTRAGDVQMAAHVLVIRIISVSFLPGHGFGEAAGILVGQSVGARRPALARQAFRASTILALAVMSVCGLLFFLVPQAFLVPFSAAPDVARVAVHLLWVAAAFQVLDAVTMTSFGCLSGAGDTRFTMLAGIGCAWFVKLPFGAALALPLGFGAVGAWVGLTLEIGVLAAIGVWRVRGTVWLDRALERLDEQESEARLAAK